MKDVGVPFTPVRTPLMKSSRTLVAEAQGFLDEAPA